MKTHFHSILSLVALATTVAALGINCRGSAMCGWSAGGQYNKNLIHTIGYYISLLNDTAEYEKGEQIVCTQRLGLEIDSGSWSVTICAFPQHIKQNVTGAQIKAAYRRIEAHGCKRCGSAPFDAVKNESGDGELTLNYVDYHCGSGVCRDRKKVDDDYRALRAKWEADIEAAKGKGDAAEKAAKEKVKAEMDAEKARLKKDQDAFDAKAKATYSDGFKTRNQTTGP